MKRALIAIASVGFLASTAWVVAANAQANINPNVYPGNTSGPYGAQAPWEWHAGPGPMRRVVRRACRPQSRLRLYEGLPSPKTDHPPLNLQRPRRSARHRAAGSRTVTPAIADKCLSTSSSRSVVIALFPASAAVKLRLGAEDQGGGDQARDAHEHAEDES